ncbi:Exosome complex component csl4 [Fusarium oxysporum f. sp. albedinis]|nr:Exosome complex component csl4 [Fusarium oxysporum f. sp. albedinis]
MISCNLFHPELRMPNITFRVICVGLFRGSLKYESGRLTDMKYVNNTILSYQEHLRYIHMITISYKSSSVTFVVGMGWPLMFVSQKQLPQPGSAACGWVVVFLDL